MLLWIMQWLVLNCVTMCSSVICDTYHMTTIIITGLCNTFAHINLLSLCLNWFRDFVCIVYFSSCTLLAQCSEFWWAGDGIRYYQGEEDTLGTTFLTTTDWNIFSESQSYTLGKVQHVFIYRKYFEKKYKNSF